MAACAAAPEKSSDDGPADGAGGALSTGGLAGASGGAAAGGSFATGGVPSATGGGSGGAIVGSGGMDGSGGLVIPVEGWPPAPSSGAAVWLRARNLCPFPLWIRAQASQGTLSPVDEKLDTDEIVDFAAPAEWTSGRVTAFRDGPGAGEVEKAEMTFGNGVLNYNVTYVDWVGLPLEVVGVGAGCNPSTHVTGCYAKVAELTEGCPEDFLRDGDRCQSPRSYCLNPAHQGEAFCHSLDSAISACSECPKGSTPEVFACSGVYSEEPRLCAALNRGVSQNPDDATPDDYYQVAPYNTYSKWVHQVCPDIYAFSYDDWESQGGFRACSGNELRVTFCPNR